MKTVGTVVRGIRTPIIKKNDDLVKIVIESVLNASKEENFAIENKDIIAITEAVVGISQNNYATIDQIAEDVNNKFKGDHLGIVFPILSRNRFMILLKAFARAKKKLTILFSYPFDEVGNPIFDKNLIKTLKLNPYLDTLDASFYEKYASTFKHPFTGVNMVNIYKKAVEAENCEFNYLLANNPLEILKETNNVLVSSIHNRNEIKDSFKDMDNVTVYTLAEILNESVSNSGYNKKYGLLGSNTASMNHVKLFPNEAMPIVNEIKNLIFKETNKEVEVMIYGDGAFKDPFSGIWELADPVVSPYYTSGLEGTPNELKLKLLVDTKFQELKGEELNNAVKNAIINKDNDLIGNNQSLGTTPRRYVDLIGSLCYLVSGSGDKGTPVIYIKDYFTNYTK